MNWKISVIIVVLFNWSCHEKSALAEQEKDFSYLIEASELMSLLEAPDIKILDFRALDKYNVGHITGALHISRSDIEDSTFPYPGMMASKTQIEKLFSQMGINTTDTVIVYDDKGMCEASRLWWILQNYNFENVKMLNGGIATWEALNGKMTTVKPVVNPSEFKFKDKPTMKYHITKEELNNVLDGNVVIIDSRSFEEYSGAKQKKGASAAGRIPNSHHIDWSENIKYHSDQRLKTKSDLEKIYNPLEMEKANIIIVYCHSGVRSAHTTFVLSQIMGFNNVKNYDGSWVEWSYFNNLPLIKDTI